MKELALHIMDIMQNSITAGSSRISVRIKTRDYDRLLEIAVEDDGCGMDEETLKKATDPFQTSRAARIVGLGLPMFKEAAILTGGDFSLESKLGCGTVVTAVFVNESIDRQPIGELGNVFFLTMLSHKDLDLSLELSSDRGVFSFCSTTFIESLERKGKSHMDAAFHAEAFINEQVKLIFKEALPELGGGLHGIERNCKTAQGKDALRDRGNPSA